MNSPNRSIPYVPENTLDPAAGLNAAIDVIDALLQTSPISMALTAPPGTSSDGDMYIVASPATGAWAGHENDLARYVDDGNFWTFFTAGAQIGLVLNQEDGGLYKFDQSSSPGSWVLAAGLSDAPSDGTLYGRRDADWDPVPGLLVENTDSPATSVPDVLNLIFGGGFTVTEMTGGVALVEVTGASLTVIDDNDSPPSEYSGVGTIRLGAGVTATELSPGVVEITASGGGGGGGAVEYVQTVTVTGAAATNIDISGLDLAADGCYEMDLILDNATASLINSSLYYNGDTTASNYDRRISTDGGGTSTPNDGIFGGVLASSTSYYRIIIKPDFDGRPRALVHGNLGNMTSVQGQQGMHLWRTAANVTSIRINSSVASGFSIGSKVEVWRRRAV